MIRAINQDHFYRLINVGLCWKNSQRALQLVHADARTAGN
jgi:hypothetical protein